LLVDDDSGFVSIIKHVLGPFQGKSFSVEWLNDGEKAIEHLRTDSQFDLILMDYFLPHRTGLEIARQIFEENIKIPIIILTANRDFRAAVEAIKYGAEDYILKEEISDTVLPRTIINVLERTKLKNQIAKAEKHNLLSRHRNEAERELVVTMCHEFNNPLAAIKISAAILARNQHDQEERELLEKLNQNVTSLEQQIIKLRDLNIEKR
jgi:CheY-like chemotaxis protein